MFDLVNSTLFEPRGSYKKELIRSERFRDLSEINEIFFLRGSSDGIRQEFGVSAVINGCNCKVVPINPIIKFRTHYY